MVSPPPGLLIIATARKATLRATLRSGLACLRWGTVARRRLGRVALRFSLSSGGVLWPVLCFLVVRGGRPVWGWVVGLLRGGRCSRGSRCRCACRWLRSSALSVLGRGRGACCCRPRLRSWVVGRAGAWCRVPLCRSVVRLVGGIGSRPGVGAVGRSGLRSLLRLGRGGAVGRAGALRAECRGSRAGFSVRDPFFRRLSLTATRFPQSAGIPRSRGRAPPGGSPDPRPPLAAIRHAQVSDRGRQTVAGARCPRDPRRLFATSRQLAGCQIAAKMGHAFAA